MEMYGNVRKRCRKVQKGLKRPEKVKLASVGCFLGIIVSSPSRSLLFKPRQQSFSLASQTTPPLSLVTFLVTSFGDILVLVRLLRYLSVGVWRSKSNHGLFAVRIAFGTNVIPESVS